MPTGKKARTNEKNDDDQNPARIRNHKFESFTHRVSRLKIDPIRKNLKSELEGNGVESYFKTGLDYWKELNLAERFSSFVQEVEPLCDSLPQILHYQHKIVGILLRYLGEENALSLESLLSLTSSLAHDLGVRFEEHFPDVLTAVLDIASKHKDIEVVEWSFTCLAWLFKYLSRILVPDLRSTYDLVAKVLGKENHKPFIARFAAEALSFLVRKAALMHHKNPEPLRTIIKHVFLDFEKFQSDFKHVDVYQYGIMSLFANTMKGVDNEFHTVAPVVFQCLLENVSEKSSQRILIGVFINSIHHGDANSINPILNTLGSHIDNFSATSGELASDTAMNLLFALSSVRHGTRVKSWDILLQQVFRLVQVFNHVSIVYMDQQQLAISRLLAVSFSYAPLDACSSNARTAVGLLETFKAQAIAVFCITLAKLNQERFTQFFLPMFLSCLAMPREATEALLLVSGLQISDQSVVLNKGRQISSSYTEHLLELCSRRSESLDDIVLLANYLELLPKLNVGLDVKRAMCNNLSQRIEQHAEHKIRNENAQDRLYLGVGLQFVLRYSKRKPTWEQISCHLESYSMFPIFLDNLRLFLVSEHNKAVNVDPNLFHSVIKNLASPSKKLREASVLLLEAVYEMENGNRSPLLDTASDLEKLTLDAKSVRTASMYVRSLVEQYQALNESSFLVKVAPLYCFGLLHFKLGQIRIEAIEALKQMAKIPAAEEIIEETVFQWLENSGSNSEQLASMEGNQKMAYNEFKCSNQMRILGVLNAVSSDVEHATDRLHDRFTMTHVAEPLQNQDCRAQALSVLKNLPDLAEKRSRRLIPVFFNAVGQPSEDTNEESLVERDLMETPSEKTVSEQHTFSRTDQKAILDIFGLFKNPRMLYKASAVHAQLLKCLASGDAAIQKASLQALSTWKPQVLSRYADNLGNLLDDTRFREEIATFLNKEDVLTDVNFEDVLPYLLRLLYGRIISRIGATSTKGSLSIKRRAVFDALARLKPDAISQFADIALGSLANLKHENNSFVFSPASATGHPTQRQQIGLLNLIKDMADSLGDKISPALPAILPAIIFCGQQVSIPAEDAISVTDKDIRRSALQCLTSISKRVSGTLLLEFLPGIIATFVTPRLENFAIETSQSVSALLELFGAWAASSEKAIWLATYDSSILDAIAQLFTAPAVKESVILFTISEIFKPIARYAVSQDLSERLHIQEVVLSPNMGIILERLASMISDNPEKRILAASLSLLSVLASSVNDSQSIHTLLGLSASLLSQPAQRVSPRSKGDILAFLIRFVPLSGLSAADALLQDLEASLIPLLLYFKDKENRVQLTRLLLEVGHLDSEILQPAQLCLGLDAFSSTIVDEPDFEKRIQAYRDIETSGTTFSAKQWQPVIYSLLFHIQDTEELLIRTSASASLKTFAELTARSEITTPDSLFGLLDRIMLPALRHGPTHKSELVRLEYLSVFAAVVKHFPSWEKVHDLAPLLVKDDEEASFFGNILHIQQHRRLRALRRLAGEATKGRLSSMNIAHFLIPLLEHFVLDHPDDKSEHNVVFETINTLSKLTLGLEWPQFRAMFRRYTTYMLTNPDLEKPSIRLLNMMTDSLDAATRSQSEVSNAMDVDLEITAANVAETYRLGLTLPKATKLPEDVACNLITPLRQYVHHKDETLVSQRVPVAVTVTKLVMLLSEDQIVQQLPPLLTDVCQILRSRTQESRDLARKTLVEISKTVGPAYFGFILKELRTALPRGYQLHVLSFTMHMLLVNIEPLIGNGELDYCLSDIANIIMDDMFGTTGQEKDAEDYISQMREIKSNKSYDSMEIMARTSSLGQINSLLRPLMAFLGERLDLRMLKKIDELLRRLGVGLMRNEAINSQRALVLCFELLKEVYNKDTSIASKSSRDFKSKRFLINMNSVKKSNVTHATTSAAYKLARFAFDLLRTILNRYDILQTPENLTGFMPVIGEGIMSNHEEVQVSVIRLLATVIRVHLSELDRNAPVYLAEAILLIRNATSTSSEASQAALKLITVLLRDRDKVTVKESDVSYILQRIRTDIDEPDRQGITFNFLKAVLQRRILVAEVYDIMDAVAAMMVRNQSNSARTVARGVYVQFLVHYPQGKDRLKKQWAFLIKNMEYEFQEGRQSVLEAIHLLLSKVGEQISQEIINTFFAPLVLATVNDDSPECRKMSGMLLKELFEQANEETLLKMLILLRTWITQREQKLLLRVSLQSFILYIEANATKADKETSLLFEQVEEILESSNQDAVVDNWETIFFGLQLLFTIAQAYPTKILKRDRVKLWELIIKMSQFPHAWVKLAASRLLGLYFADFAASQDSLHATSLPLTGTGGLKLDLNTMTAVTRSSLYALKIPGLVDELATQLVKNIVFIGRLSASTEIVSDTSVELHDGEGSGDEDDPNDSEIDIEKDSRGPLDLLSSIFARVSSILRKETTTARAAAMIPKMAAMRILASLCSHLSKEKLSLYSLKILLPLHIITDSSTSVPFSTDEGFKSAHADFVSHAHDLVTLLQSKLGASQFMSSLSHVRNQVKERRNERRVKRRIEAVTEPEKTGVKRTKKRSQQRERRKGKNAEYRAQRRGW